VTATASVTATAGLQERGYLSALRDRLARDRRYPTGRDASLLHPSGSTEVDFVLDRSRKVLSADIRHASWSTTLDAMARTLVRA